MNKTDRNFQEIEELAVRFSSKLPNETNFNNNKTQKYFSGTHKHSLTKGSISSSDTVKMSYKSCRKSKYSLFGSEKSFSICSYNNIVMNTFSRNASLRTENDKDVSNIQNFYIISYDKTSTKKEAFKLEQKNITDDIEFLNKDDLNQLEEEVIFELDEKVCAEDKKSFSPKNVVANDHNSFSTQHDSIQLTPKFEFLVQVDQIYSKILKEIEDKSFEYNSTIENWFNIANNSEIMFHDSQFKEDNVLQIIYTQSVMELIIFGILYNKKNFCDQLVNGIKNCLFYLHQNFVIILFIIVEFSGIIDNEWALIVKKKVDENRTWLNKHIYKKLFLNNINLISGIAKNIIISIKTLEENKQEENNQYDILSDYLKQHSYKNTDLKETIPTLREYIYLNFIKRNIDTDVETVQSLIYLPPKDSSSSHLKYTLVLDLDETLVHYVEDEESAYILIRPGAENFLEELCKYYELVIFTAATQDYADFVLNELDKNKRISHRLYRQHTFQNSFCNNIKDLSRLNRDLSKMLIIDNVKDNFQLQPDNGLHIKDFYDDVNDSELIEILPYLIEICKKDIDDIRKELVELRCIMDKNREYQN